MESWAFIGIVSPKYNFMGRVKNEINISIIVPPHDNGHSKNDHWISDSVLFNFVQTLEGHCPGMGLYYREHYKTGQFDVYNDTFAH